MAALKPQDRVSDSTDLATCKHWPTQMLGVLRQVWRRHPFVATGSPTGELA